jgi:GxxExxY protein
MDRRDERSYEIIGAAMEVHNQLGPGFLEGVYQDALSLEFMERNIPYQKEAILPIKYKDHILESTYRADFICYPENKIILETKALRTLSGTEEA